jgi:PPP family 3-phenylpropionic acid transporter
MAIYIFLESLVGASYHHFAPLFFQQKHFSPGQISLLIGMSPLAAVAMQPVWGMLSDRSAAKNRVHRMLLLAAAGTLPLYAATGRLPAMLGAAALFGCFSTSVTPLGETILLEHLTKQGKGYGPLRLWGTVAFAVGAQAMGLLLEGRIERFVWAVAAGYLLAAAASLLLPRVPGRQSGKSDWRPLLKRRPLWTLLALAAALQLTQGLYFSFFALRFTGELGGGKTLLGVAALVASLAEIPFLLGGDRLFARFGARKLLLCAGVAMAARWALLAALHSVGWAIAVQALNGGGLVVLTFSVVKHMQKTVAVEQKASGQMLASVITFGLGRGLVGAAGWLLTKAFTGIAPVFWVMAGLCVAASVGIGIPLLRMPEEPEVS